MFATKTIATGASLTRGFISPNCFSVCLSLTTTNSHGSAPSLDPGAYIPAFNIFKINSSSTSLS